MQAVPSLVGTGTVVATAVTGLVFAQPADGPTSQRPVSARPNLTPDLDTLPRLSSALRHSAKSISHVVTLNGPANAENRGHTDVNGINIGVAAPAGYPSSAGATSLSPSASATLPHSATAAQIAAQKSSRRRHSFINKGDWMPPPISEASRDSVSSNGSWMRRLSIRPLSQHGSIRSSTGPDSPSLHFSLGSAAPILSASAISSQQQPRNRLVKRTTACQDADITSPLSRRRSRSQMPTLRRPATSHQRSVTMQQASPVDASAFLPDVPDKYSFDRFPRPGIPDFNNSGTASPEPASVDPLPEAEQSSTRRWVSFFHQRLNRTTTAFRGSSPLSNEGSPISPMSPGHHNYSLPSRSVQVHGKAPRAYLTNPSALLGTTLTLLSSSSQSPADNVDVRPTVENDEGASPKASSSSQATPSKQAKHSMSMHFSSPTSWISRAGSIRRPKRGSDHSASTNASGGGPSRPSTAINGRRHVSAPLPPSQQQLRLDVELQPRSVTTPADMYLHQSLEGMVNPRSQAGNHARDRAARPISPISPTYSDARVVGRRQRNASSPLPPLSRLSSFNADLSRVGAGARSLSGPTVAQKENQALGGTAFGRSFPLVPRSRDVSNERPSTISGSDFEMRGFMSSVDDDDTDFKSDTIFDSIRTAASARVRTADTPIESVFDESPPSTASNGKTKRLSIQEILGQSWDSDTRIMEEEDEGISTPIRRADIRASSPALSSHGHNVGNNGLASPMADVRTAPNFSFSRPINFGRLSLNDENNDDDWARMDENGVSNNLSPPSRSLNNSLRGLKGFHYDSGDNANGPYLDYRSALGVNGGNRSRESLQYHDETVGDCERPRSNLFDWSESSVNLDKIDSDGQSLRPKTVHGKQELDLRNGRHTNRKGPVVSHVRSQSVPVVADPADATKSTTSKFGTWASGPKNASEDWDDDFDFESNNGGDDTDDGFGDFGNGDGANVSTGRNGKSSAASFAMVVPASIQATQPTVKAHSGQIRELSLLVDGLKRLCRHARDLDIVNESPNLWREAENIIALASPDEDIESAATAHAAPSTDETSRRTSVEFDSTDVEDRFVDEGFDAGTLNSFGDDAFDTPEFPQAPATPPMVEMSKTTVVRERQSVRRRSVFSPDDDIFGGGWPLSDEKPRVVEPQQEEQRPHTPDQPTLASVAPNNAMIESIMKAMQQQRSSSAPVRKSPVKQASTELFFNTNTLQELVKRANTLFHTLSDVVRHAELITQSPACTPRHERHHLCEDGSPAFIRVFTNPSSPSGRLPKSHSTNSVLSRQSPSVDSPTANGISQRLQMMRVN